MATEIEKRNAQQHLDWVLKFLSVATLPAVGAGLVIRGEVVAASAIGFRRFGSNVKTRPDDLFHLGSITKPMTGYLVARLIRQGRLSWSRTIGQSHPEVIRVLDLMPGTDSAWVDHYRKTTVADLMMHVSGLDTQPHLELDPKEDRLAEAVSDEPSGHDPAKNRIKKRRAYTMLAVCDRPFSGDGWKTLTNGARQKYSGGCIIAASMAEREMGKTWESLMEEHVFRPLGITHFAFNQMSPEESVSNTWQHHFDGAGIVSSAFPPDQKTHIGYTHSPAGAVCLSAGDFAKWLAAILNDPDDLLGQTISGEYLSAPLAFEFTRGGWFRAGGAGGPFSHNGNNGWNYANAIIDTNKRLGVFACININSDLSVQRVNHICAELEAAGHAWDAFAYLHQAVETSLVSVTADSVLNNDSALRGQLVSEPWFKSRWESATRTPTLTARLDQPRVLKGIIICQAKGPRIQTFEIGADAEELGTPKMTLKGAALVNQTTRSPSGVVIRTLFNRPTKARTVTIKVKSASRRPAVSRLLLLEYAWTAAQDFDIDEAGHPWVIDTAGRVLTSSRKITPALDLAAAGSLAAGYIVLDIDPLGTGSHVRKADSPPYLLGDNFQVWKGTPTGWVELHDAHMSVRIAVDKVNRTVWAIDDQARIRRHVEAAWVEHAGTGAAKDICVRNGVAYVVGTDDRIYQSKFDGWRPLPGTSPPMMRVAIDAEGGKLWAISADNKIFSYDDRRRAWTEHPHAGFGKAIAVHKGVPYVIGKNDAIFKSVGADGWKMLNVLQDKT